MRVRIVGVDNAGNDWGSRFYLSYAGSAPTGNNCGVLAGDIVTAYSDNLAQLAPAGIVVNEVDVLDIATTTGLSGQASGPVPGTRAGTSLPIQCAMGIEYGIARRYRGGKPRSYWPFGVEADLLNASSWDGAFVSACQTQIQDFFEAIAALSVGAVGALAHVNLSYYSGFKNIANSSGRERAVPQYKAQATHDVITGYFPKVEINSQKRRRTATTP